MNIKDRVIECSRAYGAAYLSPANYDEWKSKTGKFRGQSATLVAMSSDQEIPKAHDFRLMFAPDPTHAEFGMELRSLRLFRMPYEHCLITYPWRGIRLTSHVSVMDEGDGMIFFSVLFGHRGDDTLLLGGVSFEDTRFFRRGRSAGFGKVLKYLQYGRNAPTFHPPEDRDHITGDFQEAEDQHRVLSAMAAFALPAIVMSKDVETELVPAPLKLNKQRIKKGKRALDEHRIVRLTSRFSFGREEVFDEPGERASPRMHWRRGHLRRIEHGRIVPIAPTIVNANSEGHALAKHYEIGPA